ncbi:MAG: hypothetical protein ACI4SO_02430, partial [Muribaculaceae bacterium]
MINDITLSKEKIVFGNDSITIRKCFADIPGGRTLDLTGFTAENILAGHVIIKNAEGNYAPMPVSGSAYAALPEGAAYVGVLKHSISTKKPAVAIMINGIVNPETIPYPMDSIADAFKAA